MQNEAAKLFFRYCAEPNKFAPVTVIARDNKPFICIPRAITFGLWLALDHSKQHSPNMLQHASPRAVLKKALDAKGEHEGIIKTAHRFYVRSELLSTVIAQCLKRNAFSDIGLKAMTALKSWLDTKALEKAYCEFERSNCILFTQDGRMVESRHNKGKVLSLTGQAKHARLTPYFSLSVPDDEHTAEAQRETVHIKVPNLMDVNLEVLRYDGEVYYPTRSLLRAVLGTAIKRKEGSLLKAMHIDANFGIDIAELAKDQLTLTPNQGRKLDVGVYKASLYMRAPALATCLRALIAHYAVDKARLISKFANALDSEKAICLETVSKIRGRRKLERPTKTRAGGPDWGKVHSQEIKAGKVLANAIAQHSKKPSQQSETPAWEQPLGTLQVKHLRA